MTRVDQLLSYGQLELGEPYVFGDEGPDSFDCSGLMQYLFAKVGLTLPRTAAQQQRWAPRVDQPRVGDLVFWGEPAYHVALYVGGGKVLQAPKPGGVVEISNLWGTPSGYGRVAGLGAATAPLVGAVSGTAGAIGTTVAGWLGGARNVVLEIAVVGLGVALVGFGVYRSVKR